MIIIQKMAFWGRGAFFVLFLLSFAQRGYSSILDPGAMGMRAMGMGGAVVSVPSDPISALYYNPAGLTEIKGKNIVSGGMYLDIKVNYENLSGYDRRNSLRPLLPYFGYTTDTRAPWFLGLGLFSTLGVGFEFPKDTDHGIRDTIKSMSGVMILSPTLAYQLSPKFSMGGQINLGYGSSQIDVPTPSGYLKTEADGFGLGITLGVLHKPSERISVGMNWRSPMNTPLKGDGKLEGIKEDMDVDLYWPQMLTVGIGYKPSQRLSLAMDLKWSDWSHFDRSAFNLKGTLKDLSHPFAKGTKDGFRVHLGSEYRLDNRVTLRLGYLFDAYSFKKEWISPLLPEMSFHEIRLGAGIKSGKIAIDTGFNYTLFGNRRVKNSKTGFPGKYSGTMPIVGLQVSYQF